NNEYILDDMLEYINFCICGERQKIILPNAPMFLDCLLGGKHFETGMYPRIDNQYIGIIAIEGFPSESYPNILNALTELNFDYRFNTRFIFLDHYEAEKSLNKYRKKWQQKTRGWLDQLLDRPTRKQDDHAVLMVQELDSALSESKSGMIGYGYYTA
ncbi:conjugal transfer protein TrbE, partial [Campylobacter jejuni]|nr:conjugal transfer protein TrbE [Campylobacter jejuni]